MNSRRVLYAMMRADFLERTRRYSFLITLGLAVYLGFTVSQDQFTVRLEAYRGYFNSAWIGGVVAAVTNTMLSLVGFYLVKNTLERDERTHVGEVLAATRLTRPMYMLGKALSNFAVLAVMVAVLALWALGMQFTHTEVPGFDAWALFSPFVLVALPSMAVVSALAVFFESLPFLRGSLGNTVYFGVWLGLTMMAFFIKVDVLGVRLFWDSMGAACRATFPDYRGGFTLGGGIAHYTASGHFLWRGIDWTPELVLGRLLWVGVAIALTLLAAVFFRRFDPAWEGWRGGSGGEEREADAITMLTGSLSEIPEPAKTVHVEHWARARRRFLFLDLLRAEVKLLLWEMPKWWYWVAGGLLIAEFAAPADIGPRSALLAAWIWPLRIWSGMGGREGRYQTHELMFSAAHPLKRQLPATWIAGFLVTLAAGAGILFRLALAGDGHRLLAVLIGALFIPSLALALGTWSRSGKLFEVVYLFLWYAGPLNKVNPLDYMGAWAETVRTTIPVCYLLAAALLLGGAFLGRRRQLATM